MFRSVLIFSFYFLAVPFGEAQGGRVDSCLTSEADAYMDRQQAALLGEVFAVARQYPPAWPAPRIRQTALYLFDAVMHDPAVAYRRPVQKIFHERIAAAVRDMEKTRVQEGARVWKLYNMGYVVRTASVTVAFDVVRGYSVGSAGFTLPDSLMRRLAAQCDILFVSHKHRDHQDPVVARLFLAAGKPVVAPRQVWLGTSLYDSVTHLPRVADSLQHLTLPGGRTLGVIVYPGHQMARTDVNVVLILTPEGIHIAHLGDQINEGDFMDDFAWIDHVAEHYSVDIMMVTVWASHLPRIARGFRPRLTLLGHEDELGHPVDDRDPWWGDTTYSEPSLRAFYNSGFPYLRMMWGETFHYLPHEK